MYIYKRKPIIDKSGTSIIPAICVNIDRLPKETDVMGYSHFWKKVFSRNDGSYTGFKQKFMRPTGYKEVSGPFADMSLEGYLGQIFSYNDPTGREHTTHIVYLINWKISPGESIGIWIAMDVTSELLPIIYKEFIITFNTIRFVENENKK